MGCGKRLTLLICLVLLTVFVFGYNRITSISSRDEYPNKFIGKVAEISRGQADGAKEILLALPSGELWELRTNDLPWKPYSEILTGALISGEAQLEIDKLSLEYEPPWSYRWFQERREISRSGKIKYVEIIQSSEVSRLEKISERIFSKFKNSDGLSVLVASVLARGEVLSKELNQLFKDTGTTHLLVVSGFHVSILSRVAARVAIFAARLTPELFLLVSGSVLGAVAGFIFSLFYLALIGFSLTTVRAQIALAILTIGLILSRKQCALRGLLLALILVQIYWPGCIFEPGCQLTFAALLGIILADNLNARIKTLYLERDSIEAELSTRRYRVKSFLHSNVLAPLITCVVASLLTTPITFLWFGKIVWLAPIINALFIPPFTFIVLILGGASITIFLVTGWGFPVELAVKLTSQLIFLLKKC